MLTRMGTPMTVPPIGWGQVVENIAHHPMPLTSSPCTAAVKHSLGPGLAPCTTSTGWGGDPGERIFRRPGQATGTAGIEAGAEQAKRVPLALKAPVAAWQDRA